MSKKNTEQKTIESIRKYIQTISKREREQIERELEQQVDEEVRENYNDS